jgi:hypothetical protein
METVLGLIGIFFWIIGVMALAAGITWSVIKLTPSEKPAQTPPAEDAPPA